MKVIDFVVQRACVKHLDERTIIELSFKKRIYQNVSFRYLHVVY